MKYRALVADDEPMIRRGIISFLKVYSDFEVVAEAEDGEMALEKAKTTVIDVFFVDINMPFLNGLDFIKELKKLYPQALVVIITGYDLFEYARKAVGLGVFDYIVKPLMEDVFDDLIGRIRVALSDRSSEEMEKKYLEWAKDKMNESRELLISELMKKIIDGRLIEDEIRQECEYLNLELPYEYSLILFRIDTKPSEELSSSWNDDLLYFVSENIALEMFASLALESKCRDESGNLVLIIGKTDAGILDEKIEEYKKCIAGIIPVKAVVETISGIAPGTITNAYQEALAKTEENTGMSSIMESVIELIQENYSREDFSLQEAASEVGLSVAYLSRIFRKEAGCTFVDYLTNLRMRRASILLQDDSVKIYEVAEKVGYSSQQYFSLVFKKKLGVNPIDYKQSIKEK
ncbi:response regulator transcription factor [Butyrivibrio sp. LC3010]|uniref:response regulator transcription factor n=1 Tax=Butyrivibrio sp. LC3010 TaxID=1280680 RepID=UPI0003FC9E6C|nr:response regulator [Butyrivibrio sp. LC3010]